MRALPVFEFIGKPESEWSINECFARLPAGTTFVNGDYVGATNEIKSWPAETILNTLFEILEEGFRDCPNNVFDIFKDLCLNAMTRHECDGAVQKSGQLMGSIISFPLLCIINATVCRMAVEYSEMSGPQSLKMLATKLKVNGDDCVLADVSEDRRLFDIWKGLTAYVGLIPSVGKVFCSDSFILINSRMYLRDSEELTFKEVPFVNYALVHAKAKDGSNSKELWEYKGLMDKLWKISPTEMHAKLFSEFVSTNLDKLRRVSLYWYLPVWCGGLGIRPPTSFWETPEGLFQRKVAMYIKLHAAKKVKFLPMDASSLIYDEASKKLGKQKVNYHIINGKDAKEIELENQTFFILKTILENKELIGAAKDVSHHDGKKYNNKTNPRMLHRKKCFASLKSNERLHLKVTEIILGSDSTQYFRALSIEDLNDDKLPVYSNDLLSTQFPEEVLDNTSLPEGSIGEIPSEEVVVGN
jgi:hypothetical protein